MPIHDWTKVDAGTFHDFHQDWTIEIRRALNAGILPSGYFAMTDQRVSGPEPDVIALQLRQLSPAPEGATGLAVLDVKPRIRKTASVERSVYARRANRIAIRHRIGRVVAMIEVASPGNKHSIHAIRSFSAKAVEFLRNGIHVMFVDLFPPTPHDPHGLHHLIWDELTGEPFELPPPDKPLAAVSYDVGDELTAYVEALAVGDRLPDLPLFLEPGVYVPTPLEATYQTSWSALPGALRELVEPAP